MYSKLLLASLLTLCFSTFAQGYTPPVTGGGGTVADGSVTTAKLAAGAVTGPKVDSTAALSVGSVVATDGVAASTLQASMGLNMTGAVSHNNFGIVPHPSTDEYTWTAPPGTGTSGQSLTTDGTGVLGWASAMMLTGDQTTRGTKTFLDGPTVFGGNGDVTSLKVTGGSGGNICEVVPNVWSGGHYAGISISSDTNSHALVMDVAGSAISVGSYTNDPLIFKTNNTEKMRLSASGNSGIGTTTPSELLHVFSASSSALLRLEKNNGAGTHRDYEIGTTDYRFHMQDTGSDFFIYDYSTEISEFSKGKIKLLNTTAPSTPSGGAILYANSGVLRTINAAGEDGAVVSTAGDQTIGGTKTLSNSDLTYFYVGGGSAKLQLYAHDGSGDVNIGSSTNTHLFIRTNGQIAAEFDTSQNLNLVGSLSLAVSGKSISFKSGANQRAGTATLVAGTLVIANTTVTANTHCQLTMEGAPGGTAGQPYVTFNVGVGFTVNSIVTDTSTYFYTLYEVIP